LPISSKGKRTTKKRFCVFWISSQPSESWRIKNYPLVVLAYGPTLNDEITKQSESRGIAERRKNVARTESHQSETFLALIGRSDTLGQKANRLGAVCPAQALDQSLKLLLKAQVQAGLKAPKRGG
jgi:hypothetical protein